MIPKLGKYTDLFFNSLEQANPCLNTVLLSIILYLINDSTFVHKELCTLLPSLNNFAKNIN